MALRLKKTRDYTLQICKLEATVICNTVVIVVEIPVAFKFFFSFLTK